MPLPFSMGGGGGWWMDIVSQLSVHTSVPYITKMVSVWLSFEKISVSDSNFIHRYIIIKCRSSSI